MTAIQVEGGVAVTSLDGAINDSVTTVVIADATGHPTVGDPYYIRVYGAADGFSDFYAGETMKVTARTGTSLTVTRGADGTTAAAWSDADKVILVMPAEILQEHNDHANLTTGTPHGTAYMTTSTDLSGATADAASWTPTVTQGASVTFTTTYAQKVVIGKLAMVNCFLTITSAGTAANAIVVGGFPAAASVNGLIGAGLLHDAMASQHVAQVRGLSITSVQMFVGSYDAGDRAGISPGVTLASGDRILVHAVYELA